MNERILVIDDEENIRRMMRLTLEAAGYHVGEAKDGADGLILYADGSRWDVVILDQRMPGMDGLETLRQLKSQNSHARVVMATAYASIELAVDAMKFGATDFVRKPMTPKVLRNAISAALSKSTASAAPTTKPPQPLIETITMNGYTIIDDDETLALDERQRRFIVISPDRQKHDVLVQIDPEVIDYVARMIGRRLSAANTFWTAQARRLLSDFLWDERGLPPMKRLVLKNLDPDRLPVAASWKG
ncbi:MAG TPA: response regulator [Pyrinomonadaceae bacterium]|nr:response regulator [Pyrinomonadaceae bacterium]